MNDNIELNNKPSIHAARLAIRSAGKAANWYPQNPNYVLTVRDLRALRDAIAELELVAAELDGIFNNAKARYIQQNYVNKLGDVFFKLKD